MARVRPSTAAAQAYAEADLPAGRDDWRAARWAVVDLETTGLNLRRDEIIAIAVVPIDGGRARPGAAFYSLVRPGSPPPAESIRIHGIRPSDLDAAPAIDELLDDLLGALAGRLPVAHAAFVERGFLEPVLATRGVRLRSEVADTRELGRVWLADRDPGTKAPLLELGALAGMLGLPVHRQHHALGDALTTAQAFLALASHLEHRGGLSVKTMMALQKGR